MATICRYRVTGMTCASCIARVRDAFLKDPTVARVDVSLKNQIAEVHPASSGGVIDLDAINARLKDGGYTVAPEVCEIPTGPRMSLLRRVLRAACWVVLAYLAASLLLPIVQRVLPQAASGVSFAALFFLGLTASVSTCLLSTGGYLMAWSTRAQSRRAVVLMHLGRVAAFVVGGAMLGGIGSFFPAISPIVFGLIALALGLAFLGVSLHLFELAPSFATMGVHLPTRLFSLRDRAAHNTHWFAPVIVGAVTFVLPCGFTQTAQGLALASGSAVQGALLLGAFALGTLPVLLGMTFFTAGAWLRRPVFTRISAAVLFVFAIAQFQSVSAVFGLHLPFTSAGVTTEVVHAATAEQLVQMEVTSYGYEPSTFKVKSGVPVRWEVYAHDIQGCTSSLLSRQLGISTPLKEGMNVFHFTPEKNGQIAFSCGMGMVRGSFTVTQ